MIVYRQFEKYIKPKYSGIGISGKFIRCEGWYLFGIIPLYIKEYGAR